MWIRILKHGVFLKSGPVESIFMAEKSKSDYKYIGGENPVFFHERPLQTGEGHRCAFQGNGVPLDGS
jgi:hypothetical protein